LIRKKHPGNVDPSTARIIVFPRQYRKNSLIRNNSYRSILRIYMSLARQYTMTRIEETSPPIS
jgi:hypothetical protein